MSDLLRYPCLEKNLLPLVNAAIQRQPAPTKLANLQVQILDFSDFNDYAPPTMTTRTVTVGDKQYYIRAQLSQECWDLLRTKCSTLKSLVGALCRIKAYSLQRSTSTSGSREVLLMVTALEFLGADSLKQGKATSFSLHPQMHFLLENCTASEFEFQDEEGRARWEPVAFESTVQALLQTSIASAAVPIIPMTQMPDSEMQTSEPQEEEEEEEVGVIHADVIVVQQNANLSLENVSTEDEDEDEEEEEQESVLPVALPQDVPVPVAEVVQGLQDQVTAEEDKRTTSQQFAALLPDSPPPSPILPQPQRQQSSLLVTLHFTTQLPGLSVDADLKILSLHDAGEANKLGMRVGDVIQSVQGKTLFRDVRILLEQGPLPLTIVFCPNPVGQTFSHWFGGVCYEGVVLGEEEEVGGTTTGLFRVKYNDGHVERKREAELAWLLSGMGAQPHEHDERGRCVMPEATTTTTTTTDVESAQVVEPTQHVVESSQQASSSSEYVTESPPQAMMEECVVLPPSPSNKPAEAAQVAETTTKRPRLKMFKSKMDELWCDDW